jgi:hypothetical protein
MRWATLRRGLHSRRSVTLSWDRFQPQRFDTRSAIWDRGRKRLEFESLLHAAKEPGRGEHMKMADGAKTLASGRDSETPQVAAMWRYFIGSEEHAFAMSSGVYCLKTVIWVLPTHRILFRHLLLKLNKNVK